MTTAGGRMTRKACFGMFAGNFFREVSLRGMGADARRACLRMSKDGSPVVPEEALKLKELCQAAALECPGERRRNGNFRNCNGFGTRDEREACSSVSSGLHTDGHTFHRGGDRKRRGRGSVRNRDVNPRQIHDTLFRQPEARLRARLIQRILGQSRCKSEFHRRDGNKRQNHRHAYAPRDTGILHVPHGADRHRGLRIRRAGIWPRWSRDPLANMTTPGPARPLPDAPGNGRRRRRICADGGYLPRTGARKTRSQSAFAAGIFTNLTPEHLDFHGTMDAYAGAKAELFRRSALAVVNTDSPYGERHAARGSGAVA